MTKKGVKRVKGSDGKYADLETTSRSVKAKWFNISLTLIFEIHSYLKIIVWGVLGF